MELLLKTLGGFSVRDASGADLPLRTRKAEALLAYLAVNADIPQPRERLMALLWSDRSEQQARQSLNQALVSIRRLRGAGNATLIESDGARVSLRSDALRSDIAEFQSAVADDPAKAVAVYDGPFLDGVSALDPSFEEWLRTTRTALQSLACQALERVAEAAEHEGDTDAAIETARRLIALDPLSEDAHRRLMRLLHRAGDRASALRQYQACAKLLLEELDVEPDAVTKALFGEIRGSTVPADAVQIQSPEADLAPDKADRPRPNKPSIAVLRFKNLGGGPEADMFADGLADDLVTALARVPDLVVISGDTPRVARDKALSDQDEAKKLGVDNILQGSIRTHDNRLRCSVRLVQTAGKFHLWAERYDRLLEDVFALQDEIVRQVLIELQVRLTEGDSARIASSGTRNLEAWLLRVQGTAEMHHMTQESNARARALFVASHRADPNWARPLSAIASCDFYDARNGWSASRQQSIEIGLEYATRATEMDPKDPFGYVMLKLFNVLLGNHDEALAYSRKAISIAPNDPMALGNLGAQMIWIDEADRAVEIFERLFASTPIVPSFHHRHFGVALQVLGDTDRAVSVLENLVQNEPRYIEGLVQLAAAYMGVGRLDSALATVRKIRNQNPAYTASDYVSMAVPFRDPEKTEWLRSLLIKAGLPNN